MSQKYAHTSIWRTSDFIISVTLLIGIALEYFVLDFRPIPVPLFLRAGIGALLIFVGIVFILLAKMGFNKEGQPSAPGKPTTKIVTAGIFSYSRNPLYIGLLITVTGIGVTFDIIWLIILVVPLALVFHWVMIKPEESYLSEKFGEDYKQYMSRVRRWL